MNSFSPQDFAVEMAVVLRRQEWLTAVLTGDEDAIANLHKKLEQECSKGGSSLSSRDAAGAVKAGPCPGYENLQPFSILKDHTEKFKSCTNQGGIKDVTSEVADVKKLFNSLVSSCKVAVNDLTFARDQKRMAEEKAKKAAAEKAKDVKRAAADRAKAGTNFKRAKTTSHPIFELDVTSGENSLPSDTAWSESWNSEQPFLITGIKNCFGNVGVIIEEGDSVKTLVDTFQQAFDESSLKVTEGRAHKELPPEAGAWLSEACKRLVPKGTWGKYKLFFDVAAFGVNVANDEKLQKVRANMAPSAFGIISGHISSAKYELASMPCLRMAAKGIRVVGMIMLRPLLEWVQEKELLESPNLASIRRFAESMDKQQLDEFSAEGGASTSAPLARRICCTHRLGPSPSTRS